MQFSFNMTPKEALEYEEYHSTVTLVWTTSFKNGFVSNMENGFNAVNFIGTGKEYSKTLEEFNGCDSLGKVIGSHSYTIEEFDKLHPPLNYEPTDKVKANIKRLEAKFEAEYQAKKIRIRKTNKTKRD